MKSIESPTREILDRRSRPMHDLRISVTDRCNFRCGFCMPGDRRYEFLPKPEILTFEEIVRLTRIFVGLGVRKVRLTGGEPLLRAEIEVLIKHLVELEGITDLALTTNGYLLEGKAEQLVAAGLHRLTVSLHSLDAEIFGKVNGLNLDLDKVLVGLEAAKRAGIGTIKTNAVVMKDVNEHEIVDLARFGRERGYVMRFIEFMDVGTLNRWQPEQVVSAATIIDRIDAVYPLEPITKADLGEVAERYRYLDGGGEVGVIASVTQPFCGTCSRVRLSAEGRVYTCLFASHGHDVRTKLRDGSRDEEVRRWITELWTDREDRYSEERSLAMTSGRPHRASRVEMFRIGG